jgi:hypothetical protein
MVRFLAIKPLIFDNFDFAEAESLIKKDRVGAITFIGEHGYFENALEAMIGKAATKSGHGGTVYVNVKGQGCTEKIKRRLMELSMSFDSVIIFGEKEKWPNVGGNVKFTKNDDIFADNHQRFFIAHSPSINIALVARHETHVGVERTEAAITNAPDAVNVLAVTIGTKIYPLV